MWTNPRDWNNGDIPTGADFDTHVRDNFRESLAYKASAAGQVPYVTGLHAFDMVKGSVWQQADEACGATTYVNSSYLTWPMGANDVWSFSGILYTTQALTTTATKFNLVLPTGASLLWRTEIMGAAVDSAILGGGAAISAVDYSSSVIGVTSANTIAGFTRVDGIIWGNNVNAGNVTLQFAQLSASANPVSLKKGSHLKLVRMG